MLHLYHIILNTRSVITTPKCTSAGNHAVAIVGYGGDNGVVYWMEPNMVGDEFGGDGDSGS